MGSTIAKRGLTCTRHVRGDLILQIRSLVMEDDLIELPLELVQDCNAHTELEIRLELDGLTVINVDGVCVLRVRRHDGCPIKVVLPDGIEAYAEECLM
jgi:hypothetical protein